MSHSGFEFHPTILPGHRIEISAPELPEGCEAKVIVEITPPGEKRRLSEILANYTGKGLFENARAVDEHIRRERDSWDD